MLFQERGICAVLTVGSFVSPMVGYAPPYATKIPNACPVPGGMGAGGELGINLAINESLRPVLQCVLNFQQKYNTFWP